MKRVEMVNPKNQVRITTVSQYVNAWKQKGFRVVPRTPKKMEVVI